MNTREKACLANWSNRAFQLAECATEIANGLKEINEGKINGLHVHHTRVAALSAEGTLLKAAALLRQAVESLKKANG